MPPMQHLKAALVVGLVLGLVAVAPPNQHAVNHAAPSSQAQAGRGRWLPWRGAPSVTLAAALPRPRRTKLETYRQVHQLLQEAKFAAAAQEARRALAPGGVAASRDASPDPQFPCMHHMLGLALYYVRDLSGSVDAFKRAIEVEPDRASSWVNLGEVALYDWQIDLSLRVLEEAIFVRRLSTDVSKLYKTRTWVCAWANYEELTERLQHQVAEQLRTGVGTIGATDFHDVHPCQLRPLSGGVLRTLMPQETIRPPIRVRRGRALRVGFISGDFGIHPVVQLLRGVIQMFPKTKIDVRAYCLTQATSFWRENITAALPVTSLFGMDVPHAARVIADDNLDVLIDLNGLTEGSGLNIMAYRPAPLQGTWLGYVGTLNVPYIDFMITDAFVTPPSLSRCYAEHLLYMPHTFMVNDYQQLLMQALWGSTRQYRTDLHRCLEDGGGTACIPRPTALPPKWLRAGGRIGAAAAAPGSLFRQTQILGYQFRHHMTELTQLDEVLLPAIRYDRFVFATFSNYQKMDPTLFGVWASILRRVPGSVLWLLQADAYKVALAYLRQECIKRGVDPNRVLHTEKVMWIGHLEQKSVADLALDTVMKNGHTTSSDTLFAGVPLISMAGQRMGSRVAASLLHVAGLPQTEVFSFKEYEELAVRLALDPVLLSRVRRTLQAHRVSSPLYDTRRWAHDGARGLRSMAEVCTAYPLRGQTGTTAPRCRLMHSFVEQQEE